MKIKIDKKALIEESKKWKNIPCDGLLNHDGVSCGAQIKKGKQTGKFFVYTHRARSNFYDSLSSIPQSKVKLVASTG